MANEALDSEYENGVADVLAFVAGSGAKVERNVHLSGLRSGKSRQIDVLVTTSTVGLGETRIAVDCKRWKKTIDIPDIQRFHGLLKDVAVDGGLIISTSRASGGALAFAKQEMGIRIDILTLEELSQWQPPGTVHFDYEIPTVLEPVAARKLRRAGFRVRPVEYPDVTDGSVVLSAFQHFGTINPSGEVQQEARERILKALKAAGVSDPRGRGNGIGIQGGTPRHRWVQVTIGGHDLVKVIAADEDEVEAAMDRIAEGMLAHIPNARAAMSFVKPEGWPVVGLFTGWGR
jgi:hypothetical protein